jgi:hypothetical protein
MFDKGLFTPLAVIVTAGKITPSPEAIHKFQESGRLLVNWWAMRLMGL